MIKIDKSTGKLEKPTLLLRSRTGVAIGKIKYSNLQFSFVGRGMDELSFEVHKCVDGVECEFWNRLVDLCVIDFVGYGLFEADVSLKDEDEIVKSFSCKSLENELAQQILREFHVNDEEAIDASDVFQPTVLYNPFDPAHSLLHRVLADKAPHWGIGYVSEYFNINGKISKSNLVQRVFTVDGTSIYDFLEGDVSKEFSCVFTYDTYNRKINCYNLQECVYDLATMTEIKNLVCIDSTIYNNAGIKDKNLITYNNAYLNTDTNERILVGVKRYDADRYEYVPAIVDDDDIIAEANKYGFCPGIGHDTNIMISNQLLSKSFDKTSDSGSIKNCFYVTGGDEKVNNYLGFSNASGNNYIYMFDNFQYEDMGADLADAIKDYSTMYAEKKAEFTADGGVYVYQPDYTYDDSADCCKDEYGNIIPGARHIENKVYVVDPYSYYKNNICYDKDDNQYSSTDAFYVEGGLFTKITQVTDRCEYLSHDKFPNVEMADTTAEVEAGKVVTYFTTSGNNAYIQYEWSSDSFDHVTNTIEALIKTVVDLRYDVKILKDSGNAPSCTNIDQQTNTGIWTGNIEILKNETDKKTVSLTVTVKKISSSENLDYCKQKINITIAKMDIAELDFSKLDKYTEVTPVGTENPHQSEWYEKVGNVYILSSDQTVDFEKIYYELDLSDFEDLLKQYNLSSLGTFRSCFDDCKHTLTDAYNNLGMEEEQIIFTSNSGIAMRSRYEKRFELADKWYKYRKSQIDEIQSEIDTVNDQINEFREQLNIKTFLNSRNPNFYNQFRSYIREDEYNNQNYISDGSGDAQIMKTCKDLLDVAYKELSSACCIQYSISGDLYNIFAIDKLSELHDDFSLFNYIRVKVDDKIHKLRLIEIGFNDQNPESLDVTFAENIKSVDGSIDDTKKILSMSSSMVTTYSSTVRQAENGQIANQTFTDMRQEGLDSSLYLINNSPEQVMTFDRKGLLGRTMLDEGVYLDDQMILTANGLYFSRDAFNSVCTAIGKFKHNNQWVYGINAEYIIGRFILGENITASDENGCVNLTGSGIEIYNRNNLDQQGNPTLVMKADTNGNAEFSGVITITQNNTDYLKLRSTRWVNTDYPPAYNVLGAELASESSSKYVSFGNQYQPFVEVNSDGTENPVQESWYEFSNNQYVLSQDTTVQSGKQYYKESPYYTNMILNYGLNPSGYIEGVIIFTDEKVLGNIRTNSRIYFDTYSSAGYYIDRLFDSSNQLSGIQTNGQFKAAGNITTNGDVQTASGHTLSHKLDTEGGITKLKWELINNVARPVVYVNNQKFILSGEFES